MSEDAVRIPLPSTVLQEYLDAGKTAWTRGAMKKHLRNEQGQKIECHCQAQILYDHLAAKGLVQPGPVTSDVVESRIGVFYGLSRDQIDTGIELNDVIDGDDLEKLRELRRHGMAERAAGFFEFTQKIAPKYIGRVIDYYKSMGR